MPEIKDPIVVDDVLLAFPGSVRHLMPDYQNIPKEFKDWNDQTKWNKFVSVWFHVGAKNVKYFPKTGVDQTKALRHLKAIMGSWEPKHEHKEATVAYLLSQWFDDITYERAS